MSTTATVSLNHGVARVEDDFTPPSPTLANNSTMTQPLDPKDPEGFLRRCSGYNKKKNVRCSAIIGRNSHYSRSAHSNFLPTCYTHRDQQSYAGWCQFMEEDGEKCGRLFRWTPPYFELCAEHQGHPDRPCFFMKLPLELRIEIFRYLLPSRAIGSSTSLLHIDEDPDDQQPWYHSMGPTRVGPASLGRNSHVARPSSPLDRSTMRSVFPIPLMILLLINRQIHDEVKDFLYSTVPFTVDVRKDGTFMCGRRLLEPRRADGSSHYLVGDVDKIKERFLKTFDWAAVKNYNIDILVENWKDDTNRGYHTFPWDEEVEIYDIRDYIGVVISGILSKARNLCRLNVRLGFSKFMWTEEEFYTNIKTLVGPFERLRNVRQPRFLGVYEGTPQTNFMISLPVPGQTVSSATPLNEPPQTRPSTPLCSVPQLPSKMPLFICTQPQFLEYRSNWERWIASPSATSLVSKPPIRAMFTELKEFYTRLAATVPDVTARNGRHAFLHRARVAREQENVEAFRHLRNELITYWEAYLEQEERKKDDMNRRLSRMLDVDIYPDSWDEDHACNIGSDSSVAHSMPGSSSQSPVITDELSWLNVVNHLQTAAPSSRHLPQHQPRYQASSSKREARSSTQDPVAIDFADEERFNHKKRRLEEIRLRNASSKGHQQIPMSLQSTTSSDHTSPSTSNVTLQSSKDQQPMALNPQLHLEATMPQRKQAEMQAHRVRAMQETARRYIMAQAQAQAENQRQHTPAFLPAVSAAQIVSTSTLPIQQMQNRFSNPAPQVYASASSSASSSLSATELPPSATRQSPLGTTYLQQHSPVSYLGYANYPFDQHVTIPNAEPAVHTLGGSVYKRPASEAEKMDVADSKRQRVDSGIGWDDEGCTAQRETFGSRDGATAFGGSTCHPQYTRQEHFGGAGGYATVGWTGKGKARAGEPGRAWLD